MAYSGGKKTKQLQVDIKFSRGADNVKMIGIYGVSGSDGVMTLPLEFAKMLMLKLAAALFLDKECGYEDGYDLVHVQYMTREKTVVLEGLTWAHGGWWMTYMEAANMLVRLMYAVFTE